MASGKVRSQKLIGAPIYEIDLINPAQSSDDISNSDAHFVTNKNNTFPLPDTLGKELYEVRYINEPDSSEYVGPQHRNIKSQFIGRLSGSIEFTLTAIAPDAVNNTYFVTPVSPRDIVISMSSVNQPYVAWSMAPVAGVTLIDNMDGTATLRSDAAINSNIITLNAERYGYQQSIDIAVDAEYGYHQLQSGGYYQLQSGGYLKLRGVN